MSNGDPDLIHEPYWHYRGWQDIERILQQSGKSTVYLLVKRPPEDVAPEATARILADFERASSLAEVPVEPEIAALPAVQVRKFVRAAEAPETH
jgi:hypothetical protein